MCKTLVHIVDEPTFYNKVQATVEDSVQTAIKGITVPKQSRSFPKCLKTKEVCGVLSISRSTLYRRIDAGVLPCYKEGYSNRFLLSDVESLLISVNVNTLRDYDYK